MMIHTYSSDDGVLGHGVADDRDLGGRITARGDVVLLQGWPTPAMRLTTAGNGDPNAWYVGTDVAGHVINATPE